MILVLYVDDLLFIGSKKKKKNLAEVQLENMFEMINFRNLRF